MTSRGVKRRHLEGSGRHGCEGRVAPSHSSCRRPGHGRCGHTEHRFVKKCSVRPSYRTHTTDARIILETRVSFVTRSFVTKLYTPSPLQHPFHGRFWLSVVGEDSFFLFNGVSGLFPNPPTTGTDPSTGPSSTLCLLASSSPSKDGKECRGK